MEIEYRGSISNGTLHTYPFIDLLILPITFVTFKFRILVKLKYNLYPKNEAGKSKGIFKLNGLVLIAFFRFCLPILKIPSPK